MKITLSSVALSVLLTPPACADGDSYLEYNCMGLSAPPAASVTAPSAANPQNTVNPQTSRAPRNHVVKTAHLTPKTAPHAATRNLH